MTQIKFPVTVHCSKCDRDVKGEVIYAGEELFDTPGFIAFEDDVICEPCMTQLGLPDPNTPI